MKLPKVLFALMFLGFCSVIYGQSGVRTTTTTNSVKKNNSRPTPTPLPASETVENTADSGEVVEDSSEIIRVETNLVTVPVSLFDRAGRFVGGMKKEDFELYEDGQQREIEYFGDIEQPFTVALVLDMSRSTRFKTRDIQNSAYAFLSRLRPQDKAFVVTFSDRVDVLCEPTADRETLKNAVNRVGLGSGTQLYEAVDVVFNQSFAKIGGRKAMVLFTDGVDTASESKKYDSTLRQAEELEALVYTIHYDTEQDVNQMSRDPSVIANPTGKPSSTQIPSGRGGSPFPFPGGGGGTINAPFPNIRTGGGGTIFGGGNQRRNDPRNYPGNNPNDPRNYPGNNPNDPRNDPNDPQNRGNTTIIGGSNSEYARGAVYLNELSKATGGRNFEANDITNLDKAFQSIALELRSQYSLGFYPAEDSAANGTRKRLKVRVPRLSNVAVQARDSYIVGGAKALKQPKKKEKPKLN